MMYAKSLIYAEGYRLLAAAFRYPEVEELREILTEVLEPGQESAEEIRQLAAPLLEQLDDELAAEYNRLFAQSVAVSPHERAYTGGDLGPGLGQLAALYEAFGLRSGGTEGEVPDHIGAELEFAAFLCLKESMYSDDPSEESREAMAIVCAARKTFMQEHLGRWICAFSDRLHDSAQHPYYVRLAELVRDWVKTDFAAQRWELPLAGRHLPVIGPDLSTEVEDDSEPMTCPSAPQEEAAIPLATLLPA